jgi:hypothetical protein
LNSYVIRIRIGCCDSLYWDSAYHLNLGQEIDTTKFLDLIAHDKVERVLVVNKKHAKVFMRDANRSSVCMCHRPVLTPCCDLS